MKRKEGDYGAMRIQLSEMNRFAVNDIAPTENEGLLIKKTPHQTDFRISFAR